MKQLLKLIWILPLFIIVIEIYFAFKQTSTNFIDPNSVKNNFVKNLNDILVSAKINTSQVLIHDQWNEVELLIFNNKSTPKITAILSSQKSAINQVNALQKLLKIANIKGKQIKFIDLSSSRPYATL
jgi:predicted RNA-binding protein with RPS1 domain